MSINCTENCVYQNDGNCNLNEIPLYSTKFNANNVYNEETNANCPYFMKN